MWPKMLRGCWDGWELDWFSGEVRKRVWDLVATADALYVLELVAPLVRTIAAAMGVLGGRGN